MSQRVADEMRVPLGSDVGYSIRFDNKTSPQTRIKFVTDGILLREVTIDPLLSKYSVVIIDDAHDRSLASDILIGIMKRVLKKRPDLRVVISSATIDADAFMKFFSFSLNSVQDTDDKQNSLRGSRWGDIQKNPAVPDRSSQPRDRDIPTTSEEEVSDREYRSRRRMRRKYGSRKRSRKSSSASLERYPRTENKSRRSDNSETFYRDERRRESTRSHDSQYKLRSHSKNYSRRSRGKRDISSSSSVRQVSPPRFEDFKRLMQERRDMNKQAHPHEESRTSFSSLGNEEPHVKTSAPSSPLCEPVPASSSEMNAATDGFKCCVVQIPGRSYPVDIFYTAHPVADYVRAAVETAIYLHVSEALEIQKRWTEQVEAHGRQNRKPQLGAILIFLAGQEEVDAAVSMLLDRSQTHFPPSLSPASIYPLPLYSALPQNHQIPCFRPAPAHPEAPIRRKIVVATNIAETAVTIPDVTIVIDSCVAKTKAAIPSNGVSSLHVSPASIAACNQRAGRAGRVGPGRCYRLVREKDFFSLMPKQTVPEIMRTSLADVLLSLKVLGVVSLPAFELITPPSPPSFAFALEKLYALGAIDDTAALIEPFGRLLAELPLELELNKLILLSTTSQFHCAEEALIIASMMTVGNPFLPYNALPPPPKDAKTLISARDRLKASKNSFASAEGDFLTMYNIYSAWEARRKKGMGNSDVRKWIESHSLNIHSLERAANIKRQVEHALSCQNIIWEGVTLANAPCNIRGGLCGETGIIDVTPLLKCIAFAFCLNAARYSKEDGCYYFVRNFSGSDSNRGPPMVVSSSFSNFISAKAEHAKVVGGGRWVVFREAMAIGGERAEANMSDVSVIHPEWLHEACPLMYKPLSEILISKAKKTLTAGGTIDIE